MIFDILQLIARVNFRKSFYNKLKEPNPILLGAVGYVNSSNPVQLTTVPEGLQGDPPYGGVSSYTVPSTTGNMYLNLEITAKKSMIIADSNVYISFCTASDPADTRNFVVLPAGQGYLKTELAFEVGVWSEGDTIEIYAWGEDGMMVEVYVQAIGFLLEDK